MEQITLINVTVRVLKVIFRMYKIFSQLKFRDPGVIC